MAASGAIWVKAGGASSVQTVVVTKQQIEAYAKDQRGNTPEGPEWVKSNLLGVKGAPGIAANLLHDMGLDGPPPEPVTSYTTGKANAAANPVEAMKAQVASDLDKAKVQKKANAASVKAYQTWQKEVGQLNDTAAFSSSEPPVHLPGGVKVQSWLPGGAAIAQTGEAWQQGALAVHQPLKKTGQPQDETWTVTHLPSGLSVNHGIKSQREALQAMQYLNAQATWNFLATGGEAVPVAAKTAMATVQQAVYSNSPIAALLPKPKKAAPKKRTTRAAPPSSATPAPELTIFDLA